MFRYCECIDSADFAGAGALFARGVWHNNGPGGEHLTGDDMTRWLQENVKLHEGRLGTRHVTTNIIIDVADHGATATARSYIVLFQVLSDFALRPIIQGRYEDVFFQEDGVWHFRERMVLLDGVADVSQHVYGGRLSGET